MGRNLYRLGVGGGVRTWEGIFMGGGGGGGKDMGRNLYGWGVGCKDMGRNLYGWGVARTWEGIFIAIRLGCLLPN